MARHFATEGGLQMSSSLRLCILAGGSPTGGSTIEAILGKFFDGNHIPNAEIACMITTRPDAGVISKATACGVFISDIFTVPRSEFPTDESVDEKILNICEEMGANAIWQSGWLRRTGKSVIKRFSGRIWNQHPGALNPTARLYKGHRMDFGGKHMHGIVPVAAALYFAQLSDNPDARFARATAHLLTEDENDIDGGKIIGEQRVQIYPRIDTPKKLQDRLKPAEQLLHASMIAYLATHGHFMHYPSSVIVNSGADGDHMVTARDRAIAEYPNG